MEAQVVKVEQGSDEWDALRRCRITASRLGDVMAKPGTKRHEGYKKELVLELLGHVGVEESPEWARHGREMEPRAIARYEWKYGCTIDHDVFLIHPKYDWLGASPDGLTVYGGQYGEGMEVKARKLYQNYRKAIARAKQFAAKGNLCGCCDPSYRWQIQGNMWLTGYDHWWYVNYYEHNDGSFRIGRAPIPRDQKLIDQMEERCLEFMADVYDLACLGEVK